MTSSRPYLIRAIHEWILDNSLAPHLLVNAVSPGVNVPTQYVQNGKVILNISPSAVHNLNLGNDKIEFSARFGGIATYVVVPIAAVLAIYARENGQGMVFNEYEGGGDSPNKPAADKASKPKLKLVT
ncbi:MAG TPA: ClpXP protease specificity-enhancing factor [Gammaproteobacteria bacterium]|nr:ClpXP protease specificity-enhancing factor [Gammaproteobacteria bacterium]